MRLDRATRDSDTGVAFFNLTVLVLPAELGSQCLSIAESRLELRQASN